MFELLDAGGELLELTHHSITEYRLPSSRSWLYSQPGIREQIQRLRDTTSRPAAPAVPASQRASEASMHSRLETARCSSAGCNTRERVSPGLMLTRWQGR